MITFQSCGLDGVHNIFNESFNIKCSTAQEVIYFMHGILERIAYARAGMFAITQDGCVIVGDKNEGEITCRTIEVAADDSANQTIASCQTDSDYVYCGLMEQIDDTSYAIIVD